MKYRILVLLVLICAVLVAAVGGTLSGYTSESAFSFSIRPDMRTNPHAQQSIDTPAVTATEPDAQAADSGQPITDSDPADAADTLQQNE